MSAQIMDLATYRTTITRQISEATFQYQVTQLATRAGWLWHHEYDSRRSNAGYPDLVLVRDGRVIFAELKTARGRVRHAQSVLLAALGRCQGVETYAWRPSDWEQIVATLGRREGRAA